MSAVSKKIVEKNRHVRWIAAPLLVLLVTLGMLAYAFAIQSKAKSILLDVSALRVGTSSLGDVQALAARHKGDLRENHCDDANCFFAFEIYNTWLHRLKLEPAARFRASVAVKGGTVDSISIMLSRETRVFPTFPSAGITEEYRKVPERLDNSTTPYWFPTPVGKPYLWVALTTQADAVQREHAYAYSLSCLVKPGGGCDLPCDYLPLAWHDWQAELEKDGFGPEGFGDYYPNRKRCK